MQDYSKSSLLLHCTSTTVSDSVQTMLTLELYTTHHSRIAEAWKTHLCKMSSISSSIRFSGIHLVDGTLDS